MAALQLKVPEPFDFKKPEEWPRWKKRFEQYRIASGLGEESDQRQISTLLYCLGEEADDVLSSTNITETQRRRYSDVLSKFDSFFHVTKNVIFKRARFNRRIQQEGESAEQYIAALYNLAESCEYGTMKSELIRDRLVVGIRDIGLSERLQADDKLTLDKAKKAIRIKEAVHEQQELLQGDTKGNPISVDGVRTDHNMLSRKQPSSSKPLRKLCTRCGRVHDRKAKCPARDAICHRCRRKGHYESQCFSKTVSAVTSEDSPTEDSFEDDITLTTQQPQSTRYLDCIATTQQKTWTATILVGGKPTLFKLDTGAEVTAVSDNFFRTCTAQLQKPSQLLYGPGRYPIQVMGQFTVTLQYKDRSSQQTIFVIKGLKTNLLGLPAITALKLAARIDTITDYQAIIEESFPTLFQGLGNLGEPYVISSCPTCNHRHYMCLEMCHSHLEIKSVMSLTEWNLSG